MMKSKTIGSLIAVALVGFLGANTLQAVPPPSNPAIIQITLKGSLATTESIASNQDIVVKRSMTDANLINLATGQNPTNAVPGNLALALSFDFSGGGNPVTTLIVFNKSAHSNLVTIATFDASAAIDTVKSTGSIGGAGEIAAVGSLTGGWIAFVGKAKLDLTGATPKFTSFSATTTAIIRSNDGADFEVIMTKGSSKMIGILH